MMSYKKRLFFSIPYSLVLLVILFLFQGKSKQLLTYWILITAIYLIVYYSAVHLDKKKKRQKKSDK